MARHKGATAAGFALFRFCYYYFFKVPTAIINQEDQATRGKCLLTFGRLEKSTKVYGDN